jgi:Rieske Fe-S protein
MHPVSDLPPAELLPGRRSFFRGLTYGLGALAAVALGVPLLGYLFGVRKAPVKWLTLGPITDFAQNQTRRVTFDNPIRTPMDGMVAHTGVYVRHEEGGSLALQLAKEGDGLRVTEVVDGSSAAEAGLRAGDVLTKLEESRLEEVSAFFTALAARQPGQIVLLRWRRAGREEEGKLRLEPRFLVLAVNCAHLGCPVEWFQEAGLFLCPCHGGVYYANGERASGPPPRGLFPCVYRVTPAKGGGYQLEIQAPQFPTLQDTLRHPA